jgi:endogenous inhibitor of DNA gyrase (YacG/DUF329 family)
MACWNKGKYQSRVCPVCEKTFLRKKSKFNNKFCSAKCHHKSMEIKNKTFCKGCGKEITFPPSQNRNWCSLDCFYKTDKKQKFKLVCSFCKKTFVRNEKRYTFCSEKCYYSALSIKMKGKVIGGKKGLISKKENRLKMLKKCNYQHKMHADNYRKLIVLEVCSICGAKNKRMVAHHKDGNRTNNLPDNLVALCYGCHKKEHNLIKRRGYNGNE